MRVRLAKVERLRAAGIDPYPVGYPRTHTIAEVRGEFGELPPDTATGKVVGVAGRVVLYRNGGKLCFATLRDGTGELQVMISLDRVGPEALAAWKQDVDLGDHVGVTGEVISSRRGELSVLADSFAITAKALRPLPDKYHGLTDAESRVRQRYVDLMTNPSARRMAEIRAAVTRSVREELHARGYLEAETPVLQTLHGGANARPFTTHINAFDLDLYLRIALELYLKRLVVGGIERVYEIGRIFRNEGVDATHNPEFTMLEVYQAYGDYNTMATLTRELLQAAAEAAHGRQVADPARRNRGRHQRHLARGDRARGAVGGPGHARSRPTPASRSCAGSRRSAASSSSLAGVRRRSCSSCTSTWSRRVTVEPTFYRDFPVEVAPLTRQHREDPRLAEKWDLVAFGAEIGTAYSELVDPTEERARLTAQSLLAAGGDPEAMQLDEDFLRALEYGMPPSGGMGMGIDRMLIMLTGAPIRETVLFPLVKPT